MRQSMDILSDMGEIERSLTQWALFFDVPFGTYRNWAYELGKRSPFTESDAKLIAAYGAGKALNARGNTAIAGKRNYANIMEKLQSD